MRNILNAGVWAVILTVLLSGCSGEAVTRIDDVIYLRHKGADMPAYVHGNPEDNVFILVLHGAGSYGLAFRDGIFTETLEEQYVIVYWDQRGQGMSQGKYTQPETSDGLIELMVEDVEMLTKLLKQKYGSDIKLILMGHSWGGLLASAVLTTGELQKEYSGWISISGAFNLPLATASRKEQMLFIADEHIGYEIMPEAWEDLRAKVETLDPGADEDYDRTLELAQETMRLLYASGTVNKTVSNEKLYRTIMDNNPLTWQVSNFFNRPIEAALDIDYQLTIEEMETIYLPTLLLYGKYDVSVPPVVGYEAFIHLRKADRELVLFNVSIHHPHDTQGEDVIKEVVEYVDALPDM